MKIRKHTNRLPDLTLHQIDSGSLFYGEIEDTVTRLYQVFHVVVPAEPTMTVLITVAEEKATSISPTSLVINYEPVRGEITTFPRYNKDEDKQG